MKFQLILISALFAVTLNSQSKSELKNEVAQLQAKLNNVNEDVEIWKNSSDILRKKITVIERDRDAAKRERDVAIEELGTAKTAESKALSRIRLALNDVGALENKIVILEEDLASAKKNACPAGIDHETLITTDMETMMKCDKAIQLINSFLPYTVEIFESENVNVHADYIMGGRAVAGAIMDIKMLYLEREQADILNDLAVTNDEMYGTAIELVQLYDNNVDATIINHLTKTHKFSDIVIRNQNLTKKRDALIQKAFDIDDKIGRMNQKHERTMAKW